MAQNLAYNSRLSTWTTRTPLAVFHSNLLYVKVKSTTTSVGIGLTRGSFWHCPYVRIEKIKQAAFVSSDSSVERLELLDFSLHRTKFLDQTIETVNSDH